MVMAVPEAANKAFDDDPHPDLPDIIETNIAELSRSKI